MTYRLNELQFQLPASELQDASINILKFPKLGTSLIVSRSLLAEGETLDSSLESQLQRLEQQVQELRFQAPQPVLLGPAQVPGLELRSQFHKGSEQVFQFQLALVLPGTRQMLAMSYVKAQKLGAAEAAHWTQIKNSLALG